MQRPIAIDDYDASQRQNPASMAIPVSLPIGIPGGASLPEETQEFTPSNIPARLTNEQALAKAKAAKFRTYTLINHACPSLNSINMGCTGENGEAQRSVIALANRVIEKHQQQTPYFQITFYDFMGDNIYPNGAKSPDDPEFNNKIHDVYPKDRRGRSVLGNHDLRQDNFTEIENGIYSTANKIASYIPLVNRYQIASYETGLDVGIHQIAHTYLQDDANYFDNSILDIQKFPPYAMPAAATSYINKQVEEFFLDSNSYGLDWLDYMREWSTNEHFNQKELEKTNQSAWCEATYQASEKAGRFKIFKQHHPVPNTFSKRYLNYDSHLYLKTPENAQRLNRILELDPNSPNYKAEVAAVFNGTDPNVALKPKNCNYNWALWQIMHVRQKMSPHIVLSAHDHCEYVYINSPENPKDKVTQIVVGGGGSSDLHPRRYFGNPDNVGTFMKKHGFCLLTIPDMNNPRLEDIKIEMFSVDGEHLVFTADSPIPKRLVHSDPRVEGFRNLVLKACRTYHDSLHTTLSQHKPTLFNGVQQKLKIKTHLDPHIDCMHDVMNFLNQPELPAFEQTWQRVVDFFKKHHSKTWSEAPLATMIDNLLKMESADTKELGSNLNFLELENRSTPLTLGI